MNSRNLLLLFSKNELKISRLYKRYGRLFPELKNFWTDLGEEEVYHASLLKEARLKIDSSKKIFKDNDFVQDIVDNVAGFIDKKLDQALEGRIDLENSFKTALRIEQSMLENKTFEIFEPGRPEIAKVMRKLNKDTKRHFKKIKDKFAGFQRQVFL